MFIVRAIAATDELMDSLARLLPQLKLNYPVPTREELGALLESESSILLVARFPEEHDSIVGILTLVIYRVPTGIRARIEDVIVDEPNREQGIGEALIRHALDIARDAGASGVALSSNPRRVAANRLYQRVGFKRLETKFSKSQIAVIER